ncbi:hypothetical protein CHGG_02662 [Chaetomium globosum CBS 148.51]|uniref:Uncharacterized protein n=1 Tax=Chaetomium globosum (strain ATCC 6205 / CBS 148.51 / DSM 1962 / NBRC 6347 / NRRL 1970) TaxID=306901 RepID=Q2HAU2_CHAGB|nr:uncharacterized protein CHGG_02662 [Chaetomium globosum CBS 148.51]EAQ90727.1 hypothetical protein CHGG_02662 [Chaetomium globosum CBS 148.51]
MPLEGSATLPPPPPISQRTLQISGLLVDVYGLSELSPATTHVSCLWLHHPRGRRKEDMADIAARCVGAWNGDDDGRKRARTRGLLALAYDQRNHGTRTVDEAANGSWREGNPMHALDMFGVVQGMVADQRVMLVWQLMFAEPRVTAGVVIIGCPDYISLLADRARLSKLSTYSAQDAGASFIGSKDFPPSLVDACNKFDPKAIFFGASPVPDAGASTSNDETAGQILRARLQGKKFLLCSGGEDKLVPYRCSEPFLQWFKQAAGSWYKEEDVSVDDRVYPGVGHTFSSDMVTDSVQFVVDAVADADRRISVGSDEQRPSKI